MDDDLDVPSSARQGILTVVVLVGVCVVLVAAAVFLLRPGDDGDVPTGRLAALRAATTPEPPPPAGAVLVRRQEARGNKASDGPAIEWEYTYGGTPAEFAAHYRRVLAEAGWQERPSGNSPDQVASFSTTRGVDRVSLVLFGPGNTPNFRVLALG